MQCKLCWNWNKSFVTDHPQQDQVVENLILTLEDRLKTAHENIKPALEAQIREQRRALAWIRRSGQVAEISS